jgi:hypothetical protein
MNTTTNKYDMCRNPVYQIDCAVTSKGKRVKATKRRVRWAFGFSDREAMSKGLTGIDCRGEEHEVVMVWSLTSGKQFVLADGIETYFNKSGITDRLECEWTMKGGHEFRVVAHLFPQPGVPQFDLSIDGLSHGDMPKIFELGKSNGAADPSRVRSAPQHVSPCPQPDLRRNFSLPAREEQFVQQPRRVQSCVDFMQMQQQQAVPTADLLSFAPQPSFQDTASQSLSSFRMTVDTSWQPQQQQQQALVTPDSSVHTSRSYMNYSPTQFCELEVGQGSMVDAATAAPITPLTMQQPLSIRADMMSPMEKALNSLINFDDIDIAQESPEQMRRNNAQAWQQQQPRKQVMRTYAFDSNNMMHVYGQQQQQQHHGFGMMHTAQQPVFCG